MKNIRFLSENFQFSVVKYLVYLNRHVFVMRHEGIREKKLEKKNKKKKKTKKQKHSNSFPAQE